MIVVTLRQRTDLESKKLLGWPFIGHDNAKSSYWSAEGSCKFGNTISSLFLETSCVFFLGPNRWHIWFPMAVQGHRQSPVGVPIFWPGNVLCQFLCVCVICFADIESNACETATGKTWKKLYTTFSPTALLRLAEMSRFLEPLFILEKHNLRRPLPEYSPVSWNHVINELQNWAHWKIMASDIWPNRLLPHRRTTYLRV